MKVTQLCLTLYSPWNSPGQNTGVGSLSLLQGIFPTQGSNPDLPHCRQILYQLNHKGSPKNTGVGTSGSSQPRNRTSFSRVAGRFFTNRAIREAPNIYKLHLLGKDLGKGVIQFIYLWESNTRPNSRPAPFSQFIFFTGTWGKVIQRSCKSRNITYE